jgi:hypothetical protein
VPLKLARPLWQWRVVFLSRLGRSALDGLAKMKESDPLLQLHRSEVMLLFSLKIKERMHCMCVCVFFVCAPYCLFEESPQQRQ